MEFDGSGCLVVGIGDSGCLMVGICCWWWWCRGGYGESVNGYAMGMGIKKMAMAKRDSE